MSKVRGVVLLLAIAIWLTFALPAGAVFIGTSIPLSHNLGGSIDVNLGKGILAGDSTAFGLANMDIGVDWGVNYDLDTVAGYPYGYGGIGAVTTGGLGASLGLSMDETHGASFDGSQWGIPLAQQGITTTHLGKTWATNEQIDNVAAMLPFSGMGFPAI
jgi:hypothetical protein